jgi:hypothetical protein
MWKSIGFGAAVLLAVGALAVGPRSLWTTVRGARDGLKSAIEESKSDVQQAAEVRVCLKDLDERILQFGDKLGEVEGRARAAERRVKAVEQDLAKERTLLKRARAMLEEGRDTYRVGDRPYSRTEVNADALARLGRCEQLAKRLDFDRQVAGQLTAAVREARDNLANAVRVRQEKAAQLAALEARLENARMLGEVDALTRQLKESPFGPQSELAEKFQAFERRVESVERRNQLGKALPGGGVVEWEKGPAPDAREAIDRFLAGGAPKASN